MVVSQSVVLERGLLRVVARELRQSAGESSSHGTMFDVEIDGQEVLHTFASLHEAIQFIDMVAPAND